MKLRKSLTLISASLLTGALTVPAFAQMEAPGATTHYDQHHKYADRFGDYLDSHPGMQEQLSHNPRLVDNKKYLDSNPELKEYLKQHPGVREKFKSHPDHFFHRVKKTQG